MNENEKTIRAMRAEHRAELKALRKAHAEHMLRVTKALDDAGAPTYGDCSETLEMDERVVALKDQMTSPHASAALAAEKALVAYWKKKAETARAEALEQVADALCREAGVVESKYANRRNAGGDEEPPTHLVVGLLRGFADKFRALITTTAPATVDDILDAAGVPSLADEAEMGRDCDTAGRVALLVRARDNWMAQARRAGGLSKGEVNALAVIRAALEHGSPDHAWQEQALSAVALFESRIDAPATIPAERVREVLNDARRALSECGPAGRAGAATLGHVVRDRLGVDLDAKEECTCSQANGQHGPLCAVWPEGPSLERCECGGESSRCGLCGGTGLRP